MMNPTTWVTILNWSPYLQSQNAKYMFKILLPLYIFIEEWIIHALVGILLWNKQIKPKKSKIKYKKRKKHLLFPLLLWLLLSFSLIVITIIIIVFTLYCKSHSVVVPIKIDKKDSENKNQRKIGKVNQLLHLLTIQW